MIENPQNFIKSCCSIQVKKSVTIIKNKFKNIDSSAFLKYIFNSYVICMVNNFSNTLVVLLLCDYHRVIASRISLLFLLLSLLHDFSKFKIKQVIEKPAITYSTTVSRVQELAMLVHCQSSACLDQQSP